MDATELMRGDWVYIEQNPKPRQVDWIRSGEVGLLWDLIVTPPYLKPIPLTPEILEKNGFHEEWDEDIKLMVCDTIIVETGDNYKLYKDGKMYFRRVLAPLYYVHELQHALKLCRIEKEIIL